MSVDNELTRQDPRHRSGRAAEQLAERHLIDQGLQFVARNFRCRRGELDLICRDASHLVIVEVRQRTRNDFGGPLVSIGHNKRARIRLASACFLLQERRWRHLSVRFDVVTVLGPPDGEHELRWLQDAFR